MVRQKETSSSHQMMKLEMEDRGDDGVCDLSSSPVEQVRPSRRLWRGNRGLNDELLMKMNELEELLSAHKMTSSSWRTRAGDLQVDRMHRARERRPTPDRSPEIGNVVDFDGTLASGIRDDQVCSHNTKKSEGLRGRLYEKYMEKRDAKLREEWGLRRTHKEAKMKAMWDGLKQSQAELKARYGRSDEGKDLALDFRHAEKLKSFGARSAMKDAEQQTVEFIQTKEEENLEQKVQYVQFKFYDDTLLSDESSSSTDSKKLLSSRSASSSTSQKSVAPIPRPIKSGSIRRRTKPENSLVQSVSNNSDHRKENMKPLTGASKIATRSQSRTHARSMSISEGVHIFKEEKPSRSKSMRDISISSGELKDLSSVNTSIPRLTPSRSSKDQSEQTINRFQKIGELKPFLRRGNGIGPGAGAAIARSRVFIASDMQKIGEESEGLVDQCECSPATLQYKDEKEFEGTSSEGRETGFPSDADCEKSKSSQELGSTGDPSPANGDDFTTVSQADGDSPTASKFNASAGSMEELTEHKHGSWNSNVKYRQPSNSDEASDVNVSVAMNQMQEADPARVRKKWRNAEKLVVATNASHQPRSGVAEGFKRLFKFGKKRKGAESIINITVSISAASGAGDGIENGRDMASQSSDDPRKLRVDYSVPAFHGLNEGKVFPDQVPSSHCSSPGAPTNSITREDHISGNSPKAHRSMFSIPSFHSKGSESKLR